MSKDITEGVSHMINMGYDKDEISEYVYQFLEENYY